MQIGLRGLSLSGNIVGFGSVVLIPFNELVSSTTVTVPVNSVSFTGLDASSVYELRARFTSSVSGTPPGFLKVDWLASGVSNATDSYAGFFTPDGSSNRTTETSVPANCAPTNRGSPEYDQHARTIFALTDAGTVFASHRAGVTGLVGAGTISYGSRGFILNPAAADGIQLSPYNGQFLTGQFDLYLVRGPLV